MGPKHLPITWSLDHSQKELKAQVSVGRAIDPEILHKGSSVKKKLFKDLDQDISLSTGRAPGKLIRLKRALLRRGGGTIVKFLSYLDPIVAGFPSFIISRVVDHTKRLRKESPQRSLHDEIANFANEPVLVQRLEDCSTVESKTPVISFESIDFIGALWSGGVWTVLRSLVDRAKERQILHPSQLNHRHNMESLLAMWSVGLSVVTQELFAINLLTNENISKTSLVIEPPPRLSPVNQTDEKSDDTKTVPASGYPIDSILTLWTLGLWAWIKPLISGESQKDEGCNTLPELSRHRILAVLQQYESLLSLWSCGAWTLIHAMMSKERHQAEIDEKEKITKTDINPNSERTEPIENLPYPSKSPLDPEFMIKAVGYVSHAETPVDIPVERFHDSFMSLWSFGLWSLVKSSFLLLRKVHEDRISSMPKVGQYSKDTDGLDEKSKSAEADTEAVDRQLPTFSDKIMPYFNQFYPQIPSKSQGMIQSNSYLLGVWSFGIWDLIQMLINQDTTRLEILNKASKDMNMKKEIVDLPTKSTVKNQECQSTGVSHQGQLEEMFFAFWTLGLWPGFSSIQGTLSKLLFKFTQALEKNKEQITSKQILTPTANVSESDPNLPEQPVDLSILDRAQEDSVVSSKTEELKSRELLDDELSDGIPSNFEEKEACKSEDVDLTVGNLPKFHHLKIQQIIHVWTFGVWTLFQVLLSKSCVSMKRMEKDAKIFTNKSESNHEAMQKEDEAISPVIPLKDQFKAEATSGYLYEGQPETFFYALWTLGLWPTFSNVQVTLSRLLTKTTQSVEKNEEQITSKQIQIPTAIINESEPVDPSVLDHAPNEGSTIIHVKEEPNSFDRLDNEVSGGVSTSFEEKLAYQKDEDDQSKGNVIYFDQSLKIQQILSIWTFGVWSLFGVLRSQSCVSMKKMEKDAHTFANDMEHETKQKENDSFTPMIDLKDQTKEEQSTRVSQVFEGQPNEFFFAFWSLGLWPALSHFQNILSVFSLFSIFYQTAEKSNKEIQLSGPIQSKSDQPADQKVNGAISENQPVKKSDEDPDQGSMIGEKDWGSSHPESSVSQSIIEKEISDKIDTLQIDSTVASADEIPNACENIDAAKTNFSQSVQDYMFSSEMQRILSIWSFGVWTVLGLLKSKSCISISDVQKDAARTANYTEASFEKKQKKVEEISSEVHPACGDQIEYYLFLVSLGLLNYIVYFHELSNDLFQHTKGYVGMLKNKDKVTKKETVDSKISDNAQISEIEDASHGKPIVTSCGTEKVIDLEDDMIEKSLPETDFGLEKGDLTSMFNNKNTNTIKETRDTETLKKDDTSEMGEASLEEPFVTNDGAENAHELGGDMDNKSQPSSNISSEIDTSPLIKKMDKGESASSISLLDVWTFGLWTTGKTLFHENMQSPRGLFLSLWTFGLWPLMVPSSSNIDYSTEVLKLTRDQEHSPASQTIETDKAATECMPTKIETRDDEILTFVMSIWTFGLWSTLNTILEEKSTNRNVFDFLFNVWLFGAWPTSRSSGTSAVGESDEVEDKDTASNVINASPIVSHSQGNQDEVIPAHDALLSFMSLGLWIPVKNLKELITMKDKATGETAEAIKPVFSQSLLLYSALLSHWTCGLWSLLLGLLQGTRATISSLESESLVPMDTIKKPAKLSVSGGKDESDQQTATATVQQRSSVEEQLFDLWTFGMYGLFKDLADNVTKTDSSVSLAKSTNVLLSLWTFGLWNIIQNLNRKPEKRKLDDDTALSDSTLEKKTDAACLDSMISMWTLGLWIQSKSVMTRIFEKEWRLKIIQQWVLRMSQILHRESASKIVRDDPSVVIVEEEVMIDDAHAECAVTPDSESYVKIPEGGTDSPLSEDYEELKLEFGDLVKKFSGKLELSTINAVYEEAHGIESVAYEILESMVDSQDSFVHYDGDGNEVFEGTSKTMLDGSAKPTGLSNSTRLPVLKVVSSPLIASVKPDIPGAGIEKTKVLDNLDDIDLKLKNVSVLKDMDKSDESKMAKPKTLHYKIDEEPPKEKLRDDMKQSNMIERNSETGSIPSNSLEQKELSSLTSSSTTTVKIGYDDYSSPMTGDMTEESFKNFIVTESYVNDEKDGMQKDLSSRDTTLVKSIEEEQFVSFDSKNQTSVDYENGKHQQRELTSLYEPELTGELSDGDNVQDSVLDILSSPNISDHEVITVKMGPAITEVDKVYLEEKGDASEYENILTGEYQERAPQLASAKEGTEVSFNATFINDFTTKESIVDVEEKRLSAVPHSDSISYQSHLIDLKSKQTTGPEVHTSVCIELVKDLDVDKLKIQSSNVENVISVEQQLIVGNDISKTMQQSLGEFSENNIPTENSYAKVGLTSKLKNVTLQDSEVVVESNTRESIETKCAIEEKETADSFIKIDTFKSDNNDLYPSESALCEGTLDPSMGKKLALTIFAPAKGVEVEGSLTSESKNDGLRKDEYDGNERSNKQEGDKQEGELGQDNDNEEEEEEEEDEEEEGEEDEDDEEEDDEEGNEEDLEEISKILALAKKMDGKKSGTDDDWLSKLAKKISNPEKESQVAEKEDNRDVFGDKEWDVCQESEDIENRPVIEYDLYSEAATSDAQGSLHEYDLISHSSSAVSFSDHSSTKESTPIKESIDKIDIKDVMDVDDYATTPVVGWQVFQNLSIKEVESSSEAVTSDVFGDKEWDVCQESEDIANTPVKEYDLSSEAATSDLQSSSHEYDLISYSSSGISFSDHSSTKESTPIKESMVKIDTKDGNEADDLATTPVVVRRMFTSSAQRLNESLAEVDVTLSSSHSLIKKLSESTTSMDSNSSSSTIGATGESVLPTVMVSDGDQSQNFPPPPITLEHHTIRQDITHLTQSRVLYRGKSPSQSRLSESSETSGDISINIDTQATATSTPAKHTLDTSHEESSDLASNSSLFTSALDSQTESTDFQEVPNVQSDSESTSDAENEEVWVTETSEMVTSFVTETVKKTEIDDDGNEVVVETVRVLGADGRELSPDMALLMRSPSFVRKS